MGGPDEIRGIGYQIAYSLWRALELLNEPAEITSLTVEDRNEGIDLTLDYGGHSEEIIQVKTRGTAGGYTDGHWGPKEILDVVVSLREAATDRKVRTFRFVATGNVPRSTTAIKKACEAIRKDGASLSEHADAIEQIRSLISARDDEAREFMRRLRIEAPNGKEEDFESKIRDALMTRHGVEASKVNGVYDSLYKYVLDKAKQPTEDERIIRGADLLDVIGGRRRKDTEELLKELHVTDPALARSVAYAEERRREFTGREWVFRKVEEWLADGKGPRFFLITGEPGIGKTAIAAELTHRQETAAKHFCVAGDAGTTEPSLFTRSIAKQLTEIEGFTECVLKERETRAERGASFGELVAMPLTRLYDGGYEKPILIVVDALDEAARRLPQETILDILVGIGGLPEKVRFVLTSRPEGTVRTRFDESNVPYLLLDAKSEENLDDVREYIEGRIAGSPALQERLREQTVEEDGFVRKVEEASAGNFLYVVMLLREIEKGTRRADAGGELPRGLEGIFREYLTRRGLDRDKREWREKYLPVMGTLAVAREPLSGRQIGNFTDLGEETVDEVLENIEQFLNPAITGERLYQLYHQSLADFLLDKRKVGVFAVSGSAAHERIAGFREDWSNCDGYGVRHLAEHLADAGRKDELKKLLFDYRWIEAKLAKTDVNAVIADYDLIGGDSEARLMQRALRMSSHILARERKTLTSQLHGRLMSFDSGETPSVAAFLRGVIAAQRAPWLRCHTCSLRSAADPLIRTIEGHESTVTAVSVFDNGAKAISGSWDKTLRIWDLRTGKQVGEPLEGHRGEVTAVSVFDNGAKAISASWDETLRIWDLRTRKQLGEPLEGHTHPVAAVSVFDNGAKAISGSWDNTLRIWNLKTGKQVGKPLEGHTHSVPAVSVFDNGAKAISASDDKTLRIWDLRTGKQVGKPLEGHTDGVTAVSVFDNGAKAISGSLDGTLRIWDLRTGKQVGEPLEGHTSPVTAVSVFDNGAKAISASFDKTLRIWDLSTGREVGKPLEGHTYYVTAVSVYENGAKAISTSWDNTLRIWDLRTGGQVGKPLEGHTCYVMAVSVYENGAKAISASEDKTLRIWDLRTGKQVGKPLEGHTDGVTAVSVFDNGAKAITGSLDGTLRIWDLRTGKQLGKPLEGHTWHVTAVSVFENGAKAISVSRDKTLRIWDLRTGKQVGKPLEGHTHSVTAASVFDNGAKAISGSNDNTLRIWDLRTGKQLGEPLEGHTDWVGAVSVFDNGAKAISASDDKTLRIWDLRTGKQVGKTLEGHTSSVTAVSVFDNGAKVTSASYDGTIRVWGIDARETVTVFAADAPVMACAVTPDGKTIVAGDLAGRIHILRLEEPGRSTTASAKGVKGAKGAKRDK